jgi:hypothetical protein
MMHECTLPPSFETPHLHAILSCKECLSACWTLAIKEGNVESVACPSVTCTKRRVDRQNRVREPALDGAKLEGTDVGVEAKEGAGQGLAGGEVELRLVEEVVGVELRERLEWLKRKKRVENGKRLPPTTGNNQADPKPCHFFRQIRRIRLVHCNTVNRPSRLLHYRKRRRR